MECHRRERPEDALRLPQKNGRAGRPLSRVRATCDSFWSAYSETRVSAYPRNGVNLRDEGGHEFQVSRDHAFFRHDVIGDLLEGSRRPLDENDFQGLIVGQMDVERGNHLGDVGLLEFGEPFSQSGNFVVVEERDRADHHAIADLVTVRDERTVQDGGDRLRTTGETTLGDHRIQLAEQLFRKRKAGSADRRAPFGADTPRWIGRGLGASHGFLAWELNDARDQ